MPLYLLQYIETKSLKPSQTYFNLQILIIYFPNTPLFQVQKLIYYQAILLDKFYIQQHSMVNLS